MKNNINMMFMVSTASPEDNTFYLTPMGGYDKIGPMGYSDLCEYCIPVVSGNMAVLTRKKNPDIPSEGPLTMNEIVGIVMMASHNCKNRLRMERFGKNLKARIEKSIDVKIEVFSGSTKE